MIPIHRESIVVDCLNAIFPRNFDEQYVHHLKEGGIDAIQITIPDVESFSPSYVTDELTKLFVSVRKLEPLGVRLVTTAAEIRKLKSQGCIAVILGTQGSGYLGLDSTAWSTTTGWVCGSCNPLISSGISSGAVAGRKKTRA